MDCRIGQNIRLPIFIINLKKDTEKKEHMQKLCKKYSLECQFIDAVYGKDLSEKEKDEVYDKNRALKERGRELTPGEIGCALSHMNVYKKMKEENIEKALILEDDITFNESLIDVLNSANDFPKDWECMLLNYYWMVPYEKLYCFSFWEKKKIGKHFKSMRFIALMHSTAGYMISYSGALKLMTTLEKGIVKPIDHYTGDQKYINLYGIFPKVIEIDPVFGEQSNINSERKNFYNSNNENTSIERYSNLKKVFEKMGILSLIQQRKRIDKKFYCLKRIRKCLAKPIKYEKFKDKDQ